MKPVTVYDIAKEANVSVATVSRVLNNTAPVKKATRERVAALIEKYQFQPNALARSLTKKSTGMIGIILPDITNPFFPEVLAGFDQEARRKGYTYFLCDTVSVNGEEYARESEYLSILAEKQVEGIVMIGGRVDLARPEPAHVAEVVDLAKRLPILLINGNFPGSPLPSIRVDEKHGALLATRHLIELGHRDIAAIGGWRQMSNTQQRAAGFAQGLKEAGLRPRKEWVLHEGFSVREGMDMMNRLLALPERPSAVFCLNDLVAIGALKAATRAGLRVPEDLSIVGFDDIPQAANSIPELTTVSLRANELGRQAADLLHGMITRQKGKKATVLTPELIVRETTAKR